MARTDQIGSDPAAMGGGGRESGWGKGASQQTTKHTDDTASSAINTSLISKSANGGSHGV